MALSNMTTNLNISPINLCPNTAEELIPEYWKNGTTDLGCSAPAYCNNNTMIIAECCNPNSSTPLQGPNTISTFEGDDDNQQYVYCVLNTTGVDNSTNNAFTMQYQPFQDYQNCLLRANAGPFKCSVGYGFQNRDHCYNGNGVVSIPANADPGKQVCGISARPNITRVLDQCCTEYPVAYGQGCWQYCVGSNGTSSTGAAEQSLQQCLREGFNGTLEFLCSTDTGVQNGNSSTPTNSNSSTPTNSNSGSRMAVAIPGGISLSGVLLLTVLISGCVTWGSLF